MLFQRPSDDTLYDALIARDPGYDGFAYVGVRTTGIFCWLTCAARKPKRENVQFFDTTAQCLHAGFRPCQRCRPMMGTGAPEPVVSTLLDALEREPERRWLETDIIAMGFDASTVRRAFKRRFGMSFLEMARLRRLGQAAERLVSGDSVIDAQLDASFDSGSGFRAAVTRLLGEAPARLRGKTMLKADWIETPIGPMIAIADRRALHILEFLERKALALEVHKLQAATGSAIAFGRAAPIDQIEAELGAYFAGKSAIFTTRLAPQGTAFERQVWDGLRRIPAGTSATYSGLAAEIGKPAAVRAVGRANGANPIAVVIPCHRVVGVSGDLTGYGGGLWRKRWLLEHERRMTQG
ncbi:AraC family transcriptional regulator of adaptative response/methylated-DNA-[protein]-cysteine methyltransferase [Aminobacter niigataensis]|uniref:AraC family transcriptional regulator of adaptative response/methylated-DNA-[protein]-cysteine methyltransferase n=1 Tax=Aminobacter niigataensis TaxID=83265 RepID=A0ABR6L0L5_9HYPH|nr:trifunctional transcriptional activator/DNA repair protein Ada/methylated-DNA--[protein]-cysteine S-methyltransferase [Aminobacter niigataensis]MBB4650318.1 AraC family transcriptional regulator of adaptative response/methylated-DNA-[protein]-cysteine methyltransferase [Aminobacter niigataensis]